MSGKTETERSQGDYLLSHSISSKRLSSGRSDAHWSDQGSNNTHTKANRHTETTDTSLHLSVQLLQAWSKEELAEAPEPWTLASRSTQPGTYHHPLWLLLMDFIISQKGLKFRSNFLSGHENHCGNEKSGALKRGGFLNFIPLGYVTARKTEIGKSSFHKLPDPRRSQGIVSQWGFVELM